MAMYGAAEQQDLRKVNPAKLRKLKDLGRKKQARLLQDCKRRQALYWGQT